MRPPFFTAITPGLNLNDLMSTFAALTAGGAADGDGVVALGLDWAELSPPPAELPDLHGAERPPPPDELPHPATNRTTRQAIHRTPRLRAGAARGSAVARSL